LCDGLLRGAVTCVSTVEVVTKALGEAGRIELTAERARGGMWGLVLVRVRVKIMGSIIIRTG
jgi:hypothetical protein